MRITHFEDIKTANEFILKRFTLNNQHQNNLDIEVFILGWEIWGSVEECAEENPGMSQAFQL